MAKNTMTPKAIEQRRKASRKHGIRAFEERGVAALQPIEKERWWQIRELAETPEGRLQIEIDAMASAALLVEMGMSYLAKVHEEGGDIWKTDVIKRLATYIGAVRRASNQLPRTTDQQEVIEASDVLKEIQEMIRDEQGEG